MALWKTKVRIRQSMDKASHEYRKPWPIYGGNHETDAEDLCVQCRRHNAALGAVTIPPSMVGADASCVNLEHWHGVGVHGDWQVEAQYAGSAQTLVKWSGFVTGAPTNHHYAWKRC